MNVSLHNGFRLGDLSGSDKPEIVRHLQEKAISDASLRIPWPYEAAHADAWLDLVREGTERCGRPIVWAIRGPDDRLVGTIGLCDHAPGNHRIEIGYWLARSFRGRGLMTAAVRIVTDSAFTEFSAVRVQATTFQWNNASARVLERAGFCFEGLLRSWHLRNGVPVDSRMYARIRPVEAPSLPG